MEYLPLYTPEQAHRHDVRPGLTGLAQVTAAEDDWDRRLALDAEYARSHTFGGDLRILGRTVDAVLRRDGVPGSVFVGSTVKG
jgi:lipopolysaccharide/colanic/teichoic acid biosynthesis glycosyltransferase